MIEDQNLLVVSSKIPIKKECVLKAKPISSGNPISNDVLKRTHLVLVNLIWKYKIQETYVYKYNSCMGILAAIKFSVYNFSTSNILRVYTLFQLIFCYNMITPIRHNAYWELIHQKIRWILIMIITEEILTWL